MFRIFPLSVIRNFSMYTQKMVCVTQVCYQLVRKLSAKPITYAVSGTSRCLFSDKYKTHKYSVGRTYNCCMLN